MVKHTQTICRQITDELFEWFDNFVGLALNGLIKTSTMVIILMCLDNKVSRSGYFFAVEFDQQTNQEKDISCHKGLGVITCQKLSCNNISTEL